MSTSLNSTDATPTGIAAAEISEKVQADEAGDLRSATNPDILLHARLDAGSDVDHEAQTAALAARGPSLGDDNIHEEVTSTAHVARESVHDPYIDMVVDDRYRILSKIGEGGMGTVYVAEHKVLGRRVAIKILSQDFARKEDLVARFIQEARAAACIGHENIVVVHDVRWTDSGTVFIAMEYLEGQDLAQVIRATGPLSVARARHICLQICRALQAAHAKQIVHRDLKPENIFLIEKEGRGDFVKVLDFGIAKITSAEENKGRLTRTGQIFGTPEYMSPEQARGEETDHRVDIYAVGCILYEMLTGHVPFQAESFMGVLTKQMFEAVVPPSQRLRAPLPRDIEEACLRAMEKDRDRRIPSMQAMAQLLEGDPSAFQRSGVAPVPMGPMTSGQIFMPGAGPAMLQPGVLAEDSARSARLLLPGADPAAGQLPPALYGDVLSQPVPLTDPMALAQPAHGGVMLPAVVPGMHPGSPLVSTAQTLIHAGMIPTPGSLPHTHKTSLPGMGVRRLLSIVMGLGLGVAILTAYLLHTTGGSDTPQGVSSPSSASPGAGGATAPSASAPAPVHLIISGTPGAYVELDGNGLGRIPARTPLELRVPMPDGRERVALMVVRKNHYIEVARSLTLAPGRRIQEEFNLQQKPRRADPRVEREEAAPPLAPRAEPEQPPPGKPLRNPFGGAADHPR